MNKIKPSWLGLAVFSFGNGIKDSILSVASLDYSFGCSSWFYFAFSGLFIYFAFENWGKKK